jgi:preprotein translocase subunit YajC
MHLLNILLDAAPVSPGAPQGPLGGQSGFLIMIVLFFIIMYFLMIRPQQKKQKEVQKMRDSLKVGDKVITAGGLHGKIKAISDSDPTVSIEIADGVKVSVDKASVFAFNDGSSTRK